MRRAQLQATVIAGMLFVPAAALAHSTLPGANDVVNGALHPLTVPAHVMILLALGLFSAQRSARRMLNTTLVFAGACAAGLLLTLPRWMESVPTPLLCGVALVIAALVALRTPVAAGTVCTLFALAGIVIALDSTVEKGSLAVALKTLLGTLIGATAMLTTFGFYISECPRRQWVKIGVRVIASWIIAIAVLMLAFSLRKPGALPGRASAPPAEANPFASHNRRSRMSGSRAGSPGCNPSAGERARQSVLEVEAHRYGDRGCRGGPRSASRA